MDLRRYRGGHDGRLGRSWRCQGGQGEQVGVIVRHQHHLDARSDLADVLVQQQVVVIFQCFFDQRQSLRLQPEPG